MDADIVPYRGDFHIISYGRRNIAVRAGRLSDQPVDRQGNQQTGDRRGQTCERCPGGDAQQREAEDAQSKQEQEGWTALTRGTSP